MDIANVQVLRAAAAAVFEGHPVLVAYAFGSRIAGTPRPDSDLDVAYFSSLPQSSPGLPLEIELALASALSDRLGLVVDLRCLDHAPLETRGRVLEEGIRIYSGDDVRRVSLEQATLSYYHDYKAVFVRMREERLRRKARGALMVDQTRRDQMLSNLRSYVAVLERLARTPEAGSRNRLVHLYQDVDDRRVHEYLHGSLTHLSGFAQAVAQRFP